MQANAAEPKGAFGRRVLIYVAFLFAIVVIGIFAHRTGYSKGYSSGYQAGDSAGYLRAVTPQPLGTCTRQDGTVFQSSITKDDCLNKCGPSCLWTQNPRDTLQAR